MTKDGYTPSSWELQLNSPEPFSEIHIELKSSDKPHFSPLIFILKGVALLGGLLFEFFMVLSNLNQSPR
jgi:hypothetical protein